MTIRANLKELDEHRRELHAAYERESPVRTGEVYIRAFHLLGFLSCATFLLTEYGRRIMRLERRERERSRK